MGARLRMGFATVAAGQLPNPHHRLVETDATGRLRWLILNTGKVTHARRWLSIRPQPDRGVGLCRKWSELLSHSLRFGRRFPMLGLARVCARVVDESLGC